MAESDDTSNATAAAEFTADLEPTWSPTPTSIAEAPYGIEKTNRPMMIATKFVSLLSALGSAYIICNMVLGRHTKLKRSFDRLLLGLCVADFISSTSTFLGSW